MDKPKVKGSKNSLPSLPSPSSSAHKNISLNVIKKLRLKGYSKADIATKLGCSETNIKNRLRGMIYSKEELEEAKKILPDLKLNDYLRFRSFITDYKLKKASAVELAKMTSFKFNEYLLATGQTTVNVGLTANDMKEIKSMEKEAEEDSKRKALLIGMLKGKEIIVDNSEV